MKSNEIVLIGSAGFGAGYSVHHFTPLQSDNAWIDALIGIGIAVAGWFLEMDGLGEFVEGFGLGYAFDAIV